MQIFFQHFYDDDIQTHTHRRQTYLYYYVMATTQVKKKWNNENFVWLWHVRLTSHDIVQRSYVCVCVCKKERMTDVYRFHVTFFIFCCRLSFTLFLDERTPMMSMWFSLMMTHQRHCASSLWYKIKTTMFYYVNSEIER